MLKRILIAVVVVGVLGWAGRYVYLELQRETVCSICHRALHEATSFRVHLQNGDIVEVCCPRCGLRYIDGRDDVASMEAADFNTGVRFDATEAFYVENSSVHICCKDMAAKDLSGGQYDLVWDRCLPSLIAFRNREEAETFREQYGGIVKVYEDLLLEDE